MEESKIGWTQKVWSFFEGKKTLIGLSILLANAVVSSKFPQVTSPEISSVIELIGGVVGGVGMFDKARRTETGQRWQNKLTGKK